MVKNPPANVVGLPPGSGRSLGVGNGTLLQDSCLENPMHRGAWRVQPGSHTRTLFLVGSTTCESVSMLTPHCLALCDLIIRSEIWLYFSNFVALLQSCFDYPRAFALNFRISLVVSREACLDFGWHNTESTDEFRGIVILTILSLSERQCGLHLHYYGLLIFSTSFCGFQCMALIFGKVYTYLFWNIWKSITVKFQN